MEQNERKSSGINIGSASIIMVFAVLCLTVFAVLTFITANNEYKLAEKSADSIRTYYEADTKAVITEGKIRESIANGDEDIAGVIVTTESDGRHYEYAETVDDNQIIEVELLYADGELKTLKWELKSIATWSPDNGIKLWDGEN